MLKSTLTFLSLLTFFSLPVLAQRPYFPTPMPLHTYGDNNPIPSVPNNSEAFVVTRQQDTIRGILLNNGLHSVSSKVKLEKETQEKITFDTDALKAVVIRPNRKNRETITLEIREIDGKKECLHRLVDGYAKLYALYTYSAPTTYYTQKAGDSLVLFGQFGQGLGFANFRKVARVYFQDNPDLQEKINQETYTVKNIAAVFEAYNQWYYQRPRNVEQQDSF